MGSHVKITLWPGSVVLYVILDPENREGMGMARVKTSKGKFDGINAVADKNGVIAALAIDQRGSLKKAIAKAKGSEVGDGELVEFKTLVAEILTPYASAILLDPEYGLEASKHRATDCGLLLAYERTGYDASVKGRLPDRRALGLRARRGTEAAQALLPGRPGGDPQGPGGGGTARQGKGIGAE
jgi:hypothetical protein